MKFLADKRNFVAGTLSCILLIGSVILYFGTYRTFADAGKDVVTIGIFSDSYWEVPNGYSYQILEDAIQVFEKEHPGIKVEYVSGILKEDYSEWLSGQLLSGNAPDVFYVLSEDFNNLAEIGALKDLQPFIEEDKDFRPEAFYSSAYAYGQCDGVQYSLPYECAPKLMFVNKTILDREGLSISDEAWTWDEFYQICEKVTKDTDGNGNIDQFGVIGYTWREAFESNGIQLFNQQGTKCCLTGDNVEEAIAFTDKLGNLSGRYSANSKDFDLGNVVFQPMLFSEYRAYKPYPLSIKKYSGFEWECIPMPAGPHGDNISTLDTLLLAMNEDSVNIQAAWDLMKVLTCRENIQSEIFDYSEGVSVLKGVTESDQTLQQMMDSEGAGTSLNLNILSNAVENAVVAPRFRNYEQATAEVDRAVTAILEESYNISMGQIIWNRRVNKYLKNSF